MQLPCTIKALKYVTYGQNLEMNPGELAGVLLEAEQGSNRYRSLKVTAGRATTIFTEKALENAIARGDFELV